jgi:RNA-directed DNA polymerase
MKQAFNCLAKKKSAQWILEGDIAGAFDNVSHNWMLENIPMDKEILSKILKSGYVDCEKLYPTEEGTAQGGVISPTIFNCVLGGLETEIRKLIPQLRKKIGANPKINCVRYADDFIVTGTNKEILEQHVKPVVERFLRERGLQLSQEKTVVSHINNGFDFLGWNIRKFKDKLIIQPAKTRVKGFLNKVRGIITIAGICYDRRQDGRARRR